MFQRELGNGAVVEAAYVASHRTDLSFPADINQLHIGSFGLGQSARPYPQFQGIGSNAPYNAISNYDYLQLSFRKRFGHGLSVDANYVWSKMLDDQDQAEQEYKAAWVANPFDERSESRLGEISARRSELKDAFAHYSRVVELQPNDADASLGLAKVLIAMSQPEALLEHSAQLEPFNAATRYHLAAIYRKLGRDADARRELAEFQKLKEMKHRLREIYHEMRLEPAHQERPDTNVPNYTARAALSSGHQKSADRTSASCRAATVREWLCSHCLCA